MLVGFGVAAACSNDSETNWTEPVGGAASSAGSAGKPTQVGGSATAGKGGGDAGSGGATQPHAGAAGSPTGVGGAEAGAGGEPQGGAGAAGAPPSVDGGAGGEGGFAGGGGEGGQAPIDCEDDAAAPTQLPSCSPATGDEKDACRKCLKAKCCAEWQGCFGKAPQNECGYGAKEAKAGELECVLKCYRDGVATSIDPDELLAECASTCAGACLFLTTRTNDVLACGFDECDGECFPVD